MIVERKYLAHFVDANMINTLNASTLLPSGTTNYVRLGKHLEAYSEELNPQIEQHKNILGDPVVIHGGYQPSSSVDTYYAEKTGEEGDNEPLYDALQRIAVQRLSGENTRTTCVDAMIRVGTETTIEWAYKEDCYIAIQSFGGDTKGVQIPFQLVKAGNRKKVIFAKSGTTWRITGVDNS